ncbi:MULTISPECIES: hypothetical protein [unclassified Thioalkalivibrio]|uniref:hypothetical protein n=1 Tax=unclassified Thioalkalivibrio TaxID=2621013 RepID=UPI00056F82F1|nr:MULTISPECIES: hypothetical protein [unclassified Thioalkalivibrio]
MGKVFGLMVSALYRSNHIVGHFFRSDVWGQFQAVADHYGPSVPVIARRVLRLYGAARFLSGEVLFRGLRNKRVPMHERLANAGDERVQGFQFAVNSSHAPLCRNKHVNQRDRIQDHPWPWRGKRWLS